MSNKLMFSVSLILVLNIHEFASESGFHEIRVERFGLSLREERINARVCEGEYGDGEDEEWDLCFNNSLISSTSLDANDMALKHTHCMCDNECDSYRDCCVDNISEELIIDKNLNCIELFSEGVVVSTAYGIDRCPNGWQESDEWPDIKPKCELDAFGFESLNKSYSYLQDIPVISEKSNLLYRNIFCAVCNSDSSDLKTWNLTIECEGFHISDKLQHQTNNIDPKNYDPLKKSWKVFLKINDTIKPIECTIAVKQLKDHLFYSENNLRKCHKTIANCPDNWSDSTIDQKCRSYASYVYENDKSYKNYHCALCNGVPLDYISCFPNITDKPRDFKQRTLWFPLLLDFNFGGNRGELVGGEAAKCPNSGQLYDPLYDKCVSIMCSEKWTENADCFSEKLAKSRVNCSAFVILVYKEDFIILQNKSIYINNTQSIIDESIYQLIIETNQTKLKICLNESQLDYSSLTQSPFDVGFGQIILSELSLYTSIFCLSVHLLVYTILPKLQTLPGKNLMSLSVALLLGHICFVSASYLEANRQIVCVLVAITTHYSYLAAFFWMSVMAYDICKTFRRTTSRRQKSSQRYKFLKYSLYAWLTPAFIVLLSAAFDIGLKDNKFQPLYGHRFCWISQRQALLVFFALPVAVIVCVNLLLFCLTTKGLLRTEEQTKILNKKSNKIRYILYVKLAIIMGLTWVFGFIASLTAWKVLWYPFIVLNGLQGAIIFIAFTCKPKVCKLLVEKFRFSANKRSVTNSDVIRSASGSGTASGLTTTASSTLVPSSPNTNVTQINFPK